MTFISELICIVARIVFFSWYQNDKKTQVEDYKEGIFLIRE